MCIPGASAGSLEAAVGVAVTATDRFGINTKEIINVFVISPRLRVPLTNYIAGDLASCNRFRKQYLKQIEVY